jgi:hypothetical protein
VTDEALKEDISPIRQKFPDIPPRVEEILHKAMQRDLDKRYASASEMGYDLEHYMYDDGYGPTILALAKYLREMFPEAIKHPIQHDWT